MSVSESTAERFELQDPDVRLMLRVRDDDAAAFEQLMLRYQARLIRVLEHLVGRRDLAEDLAQDVFLRIYRSRKRYVPGSKFSTWMFTIANNVALNAKRSLSRRREVNVVDESGAMDGRALEQMVLAASGQMPTRQLDRVELCDMVRIAIGALSERQRLAVLLSKFEHLSYAEIAEIMELTPQAIKSLLSRARSKLKEVLEPYMNDHQ